MYASHSVPERLMTGFGSIAVVGMIGYVLVAGLTVPIRVLADNPMAVLDMREAPKPPPEQPPPPEPRKHASPMKHAASSENLKAQATPIIAPPLPAPVPSPVIAAVKPNIGAAADSGASDRAGPGQGAGGVGDGLGGGGDGEGGDVPPHRTRGQLGFSDMPAALRAEGVERTVGVRYAVNVDGRVSNCTVTASSGDAGLDQITCQLIEKRFRFDPSRDGSGRPVRSVIVEEHSWRVDRNPDRNGA